MVFQGSFPTLRHLYSEELVSMGSVSLYCGDSLRLLFEPLEDFFSFTMARMVSDL